MALQWEFLNHRHDYPDPLAAAQHEARTLALDNAHLVGLIETLEAEKAQIEAERVIAVRSAWFWRNQARVLGRTRRSRRNADRLMWSCVLFGVLAGLLALIVVLTAVLGG
jgi:hypothetical protein